MCAVLGVSKSGYYNWKENQNSEQTKQQLYREEVKQKIRQFFYESMGTYGSPRVHMDLLEDGYNVSERTVGRYMKEMGLRATPPEKYKATTQSDHGYPVYPNLIGRNFHTDGPNKVWTGDMTYIWTREGWLYLSVLIDLYSRLIVGWSLTNHMRADGPLEALNRAIALRQPEKDLIHHTDQGSQYASKDYVQRLKDIEACISMSQKGTPYDNATSESFFATLKKEVIYRRDFKTRKEAIQAISWYITMFYNKKRRHSYNNYLSPEQFEIDQALHQHASQNQKVL